MSLSVGIVGLPNVGKSTLFNALLKRQTALVANYPFATIEPNIGIVDVPDERLSKLADIVGTEKIVPATVKFVDIAGLVAGASKGEGLGNKFLSHIREVELIVHLLRAFEDEKIVKEGSVNPVSDYELINMELILKDLETVEKIRQSKSLRLPENQKKKKILDKLYLGLSDGVCARDVLEENELENVADLGLLSAKRAVKVLNVSEADLSKIDEIKLKYRADLVVSAKIESELSVLSDEDALLFLDDLGLRSSGLDRLVRLVYDHLGLLSFLTAGEKEVRAWTIKRGLSASRAAGVIHSDFEKKFIKARVCSYGDFVEHGGWKGVGESGKVRFEGSEYVIESDDVIEFMIGK